MSTIDTSILLFLIASFIGFVNCNHLLWGEIMHPVYEGQKRLSIIVLSASFVLIWATGAIHIINVLTNQID